MKVSLYTNRLDKINNQLSDKTNKLSHVDYTCIKNNIEQIKPVYSNDKEMFEYSKDLSFKNKHKNVKGQAISDFLQGIQKGSRNVIDSRSLTLQNVIERNKNDKIKKITFEKLSVELTNKFKRQIATQEKTSSSSLSRGRLRMDSSRKSVPTLDIGGLMKNSSRNESEKIHKAQEYITKTYYSTAVESNVFNLTSRTGKANNTPKITARSITESDVSESDDSSSFSLVHNQNKQVLTLPKNEEKKEIKPNTKYPKQKINKSQKPPVINSRSKKPDLLKTTPIFMKSYELSIPEYNSLGAPALTLMTEHKNFNLRDPFKKIIGNDPPISKNESLPAKVFKPRVPMFKSGVALNKFLIRDFLIGESIDPTGSSKKKLHFTTNMFEYREENKLNKITKARQAFEMLKYGAVILEEDKDDLNDLDVNMSEYDRLNFALKKMNDKKKESIKEKSKKLVEMLQNISNSSYEELKEGMNIPAVSPVNRNNLERVIRVRNILKKGVDMHNENLGIEDLLKFKEQRKSHEDHLLRALKSLGPPPFLKTSFKKATIEKYRVVNGQYFGCPV